MFWRLLYRQPSTSIGTLTLILIIYSAEASLVRLPLHAPVPTPPKKGAPGPGWLSVTATPPPVQQKTLLASTAFFASLGVFIVGINTNALRLFAHFFRRLPRRIYLKKQYLRFGNLPKKSSAGLKIYRESWFLNLEILAFLET